MNTLSLFAHGSLDASHHTSNVAAAADPTVSAGVFIFFFIVFIATYAISALLLGRIFKKAGIESWIAWVPFYNTWKTLQIGGQKGYWAVLALIPIVQYVSIVFMFIAYYNIGLKLGKSGAFVLWSIFVPIVWIIWLAVDKSTWNSALGAPSTAPEHTGSTPAGTPPAAPITTPTPTV